MANGCHRPIGKYVFGYNFTSVRPICAKFCIRRRKIWPQWWGTSIWISRIQNGGQIWTETYVTDADDTVLLGRGFVASTHCCFFYRAMHFSAKRGIAIACRLSVRLRRWW